MKRVGYLWEKFCTEENAILAIRNGTKNIRSDAAVQRIFGSLDRSAAPGTLDPQKVQKYAKNLVAELQSGEWRHGAGYRKTIISGAKVRDLNIANLKDHIVQWMTFQIITDFLTKRFYRYSVGNLPGRGLEDARRSVERWVRSEDCKYFVKLDLRHFYLEIELDLLSAKVHTLFKDKRYLAVLDQIIYAAAIPDENGVLRNIAIGHFASAWLSNIYLDDLDKYITEQIFKVRRGKRSKIVKHYIRNVDDMLLFGSSKKDLEKAVRMATAYARDQLGVQIKPCWEICRIGELLPPDDNGEQKLKPGTKRVDLCGYTFTTTTTTVRDRNFLHASRVARKIHKRLSMNGVVYLQNALAFLSLVGWFKHADSVEFFRKYINPYVNIEFMKEIVSYANKNHLDGKAARVYCRERLPGSGSYQILYGCSGDPAGTSCPRWRSGRTRHYL